MGVVAHQHDGRIRSELSALEHALSMCHQRCRWYVSPPVCDFQSLDCVVAVTAMVKQERNQLSDELRQTKLRLNQALERNSDLEVHGYCRGAHACAWHAADAVEQALCVLCVRCGVWIMSRWIVALPPCVAPDESTSAAHRIPYGREANGRREVHTPENVGRARSRGLCVTVALLAQVSLFPRTTCAHRRPDVHCAMNDGVVRRHVFPCAPLQRHYPYWVATVPCHVFV
jgi:hypothetical protein